MSPERVEPGIILSDALSKLRAVINQCQGAEIGMGDLVITAGDIWDDLERSEEIQSAIEVRFREMRMAAAAFMGTLNVSKGDPFRTRFNPHKWGYVPKTFEGRESEYVLDRSKAFLNLLESLRLR